MDLPEEDHDDFFERMVVEPVDQPSTSLHSFKDHSFSELMKISEPLRKLRKDYASHSAEERRMAADYEYHAASANQLFYDSIGQPLEPNPIPGEVVALAIDPNYTPTARHQRRTGTTPAKKDHADRRVRCMPLFRR